MSYSGSIFTTQKFSLEIYLYVFVSILHYHFLNVNSIFFKIFEW